MRKRLSAFRARVRGELEAAIRESHTPSEISASFTFGVFLSVFPTLGLNLVVFLLLAWLSDRVSKVALFASVVVVNPVVKWGLYVASFAVGVAILGSVEGVAIADLSFRAGPDVLTRLLLGSLIIAVAVVAPCYALTHRSVVAYRRTDAAVVAEAAELIEPEADVEPVIAEPEE
ncbi:DUF2062 domain-containing protein [Haloparvum sp. PAK95]|uniref:DUF2062 domain-containing protein n=1 Tax=Haloparvum sp. PAK95 TaxID=3418962 RepID=UPI003D2EB9FF